MPEATLSELMAACTKAGSASTYADVVVLAFQTRATRGMGKGEKDLFYQMLAKLPEEAVLATLPLVPHFGYYKDYLLMMKTEGVSLAIKERALSLMAEALLRDEKELEAAARTWPPASGWECAPPAPPPRAPSRRGAGPRPPGRGRAP